MIRLASILAACVAVFAGGPAAAAAAAKCEVEQSPLGPDNTVETSAAIVFERDDVVVVCDKRTGKTRPLPTTLRGDERTTPRPVRTVRVPQIAGRYVAYVASLREVYGGLDTLMLYDVRAGKLIASRPALAGMRAGSATSVQDFVLRRDGTMAWIAQSLPDDGRYSTSGQVEVRLLRRGRGASVRLDRAEWGEGQPPVRLASLNLSADRRAMSWTHDGAIRTAPLD